MSPADLADDADEPQTPNGKTTITIKQNQQLTVFSLRNNAACCIPLRNQRYLRENNHMRVLNLLAQRKPQYLPQISQIITKKPQNDTNSKTTQTSTCLSLRNNAACCIPLRDLRNLRENNHARVLNQSTQTKPQCLPLISQMTQTNPKTTKRQKPQKPHQPKLSFSAK